MNSVPKLSSMNNSDNKEVKSIDHLLEETEIVRRVRKPEFSIINWMTKLPKENWLRVPEEYLLK